MKNKRIVVQEFLQEWADGCTPINPNHVLASKLFAGAIKYASSVFGNHLVLGGAYRETKDCQEILDHLKEICKILEI